MYFYLNKQKPVYQLQKEYDLQCAAYAKDYYPNEWIRMNMGVRLKAMNVNKIMNKSLMGLISVPVLCGEL